jgi:hypothetical protein
VPRCVGGYLSIDNRCPPPECDESQTETSQHKTQWVSDKRITPDYKPDVRDACGCEQVLLEDKATLSGFTTKLSKKR